MTLLSIIFGATIQNPKSISGANVKTNYLLYKIFFISSKIHIAFVFIPRSG
jgi:hypothetical protein